MTSNRQTVDVFHYEMKLISVAKLFHRLTQDINRQSNAQAVVSQSYGLGVALFCASGSLLINRNGDGRRPCFARGETFLTGDALGCAVAARSLCDATRFIVSHLDRDHLRTRLGCFQL